MVLSDLLGFVLVGVVGRCWCWMLDRIGPVSLRPCDLREELARETYRSAGGCGQALFVPEGGTFAE
jgi:hypothetical protein